MPRYFFNVVHSGQIHRDGIGQEFSTEGAALDEARLIAGELLRDAAFSSRTLDHILEVSDREGNVVNSDAPTRSSSQHLPGGPERQGMRVINGDLGSHQFFYPAVTSRLLPGSGLCAVTG
jgi:hypothetical protein